MANVFYLIVGITTLAIGYKSIDSWQTLQQTITIIAALAVSTMVNLLLEKVVIKPKKRRVHYMALFAMLPIFASQLAVIYFSSVISPYSGALMFGAVILLREGMEKMQYGSMSFRSGRQGWFFILSAVAQIVAFLSLQLYFEAEVVTRICLFFPILYFFHKWKSVFRRRSLKKHSSLVKHPMLLKIMHLVTTIGKESSPVRIDDLFFKFDKSDKTAYATQDYSSREREYNHRGAVCIPAEIAFGRSTYKVTSIGTYAFGGSLNLKSVTINEGVEEICMEAFHKCWEMTNITIPASVNEIDMRALSLCPKLENIHIHRPTPPETSKDALEMLPDNLTIHVPQGAKEAYQAVSPWKKFNIVEVE